MDRLRRTLSFRKKKGLKDEATEWREDERKVREGTCCFQVKYLGCIEVFEATGMRVCEEAVKLLRANAKKSDRLSFRRKRRSPCPVLALLYICGDSLRIVENSSAWDKIPAFYRDDSQGLIVDQTVEKVSFCAPDRNHVRGFAYICRDGTTKRWMCHGFITLKETGERLSHAIGCAFAVCLETKQKREKELVEVQYNPDKTSFQRQGSFKQTSLTERRVDPQSAIIAEPLTSEARVQSSANAAADSAHVERPRPAPDIIMRQGSFREFSKLNSTSSAFKRNPSLRLNDLPSTLKRQAEDAGDVPVFTAGSGFQNTQGNLSIAQEFDPITAMCQQLTSGLFTLHSDTATTKTNPHDDSGGISADSQMPAVKLEPIPIVSTNPWSHTKPAEYNTTRSSADSMNVPVLSSTNPFATATTSHTHSTNPFFTNANQPMTTEFILNV